MTKTVERKPITQAMQLALWKKFGHVVCRVCNATCGARSADLHIAIFKDGTGLFVRDFH